MKFNKILKSLIIGASIITITSCSIDKNLKNTKNSDNKDIMDIDVSTGVNNINTISSSDDILNLQIQQLQKNNVVYFGLDKYNINSNFTAMLDSHALFLKRNPSYKIIVEGHADKRGTPEYNISLGERRANAVKMYLQGKGVSDEQISIISYGKEKLAMLGNDETAHAKNRRAVIIY